MSSIWRESLHSLDSSRFISLCRLKYEDCVPDEDLKRRIDAWIAEGTRPSNMDETVSMDVDEVANRPE